MKKPIKQKPVPEQKSRHERNKLLRLQELKDDKWYPWKNEEEYHQKDIGERADYLLGKLDEGNNLRR
jgi:hypothetical protein